MAHVGHGCDSLSKGASARAVRFASACRHTLQAKLEELDIRHHFQALITAEDGMETRSQMLLSAAIKLGRPPNRCVAFVSDTPGITAAHNASLRAVAVVGKYAGYQLRSADLTCASLGELAVYNVRRLFANAGQEFMDLRKANSNDDRLKKKASGVASM